MAEEVDPKLLKQARLTQDLLGEFVKRPSLTEKHLMRPPFRYLHDVFMAVTEATGFFRGLFTPEEQNPANFTTKEAKAAFIEKVVAVVELTSGQTLDIKTAKVLAGSEADKTNNLLQILAKCLKKRQSSDEAVKSVTGVDPKETKSGRRGSNSNEPVKANLAATKRGTGASQDPKGKAKDKPEKGAAAAGAGKTRAGPGANADKDSKAATKFNSYAPSKTPASKAAVPPAGNKTKPAPRRLSTENAAAAAAPKSMRVTPSGPSKDTAAVEDVETKHGASRSRRGSFGSPAPKNRKEESEIQKPSIPSPTPREVPAKVKVEDEQPQPPQAATASTSHDELMGEINFLSNQFGYDCDIEDCEESEAGGNDSVLVDSGDVGPLNQNPPGSSTGMERRPSLDFANATGGDESEDNGDEDDVANVPSRSPISGQPDPALVDGKSAVTGASARQRPPSRNTLRKLTEAPKQELEQAGAKSDNENKPAPKSVVPEKAPTRPPTAGMGRPPASARPSSARPGAPRPRSALKVIVDENAYRPPTGKVVNVLMDNEKLEEDDSYVVQEVQPPMKSLIDELDEVPDLRSSGGPLALGDVDSNVPESERGLLLSQILETQKALEGSRPSEDGAGDAERFKHIRENTRAEVEKLQNLIQTTAKSAHPFGKLMDFIQEDVDSIHKELNRWQEESLKLDVVLEEEIAKTEEALAPKRQELAQIREAIQNKKDAMESTRMDILNHQARLAKITNSIEHVKPPGQHNYTIKFPSVVKLFGFEAEFSSEERVMVFGEGGRLDQSSDPPPLRTRPMSQYRTARSPRTSTDNIEKPEPFIRKDSLGQNGPDMRARMKNLASTLAKDMGQDEDEEELEGFDPGLDGFRGSVTSSRSSVSPNFEPIQLD